MRALTPTLRAAQQAASAEPYLRVRLFDRDAGAIRLRWQRIHDGDEPDGPCALAAAGDGALLRARIDPTTGALSRQRIADPAAGAGLANWTAVASAAVAPRLGLAASGSRALLASVRGDGVSVELRESADSGATFGAPRPVAVAASAVTATAAAIGRDGSAVVLYASGGTVFAVRREALGAWGAPAAWSRSLATVSALAAYFGTDCNVLVSGTDEDGAAGVWSTVLGVGGATPPDHWLPLAAIASAAPGSGIGYLATGALRADAPQAVVVESYRGAGAYDRVQIAAGAAGSLHGDGQWRDPRPFAHASPYGLAAAVSSDAAWLAAPHAVWRAPFAHVEHELTDDVLDAVIELREQGRLRLTLRNDGAGYAASRAPLALAAGGELRVEPGYRTSAGIETSEGPRFWIGAVRRRRSAGVATVELDAVDGLGLIEAWVASDQLVWQAGERSAVEILAAIVQRAGLRLTVRNASAEAVALRPAFTVRAGERGGTAMRRLLRALPDRLQAEGRLLVLSEPVANAAAHYAYGAEHAILAHMIEAGRPAAGWARVFGRGVFAEATDEVALAEGAGTVIAVDENLGVQDRADARAGTLLRQSRLAVDRGELLVRPNVAHEQGDIVAITDAESGLDGAPFRVAGLRLRFARGARPRYEQTLTLSEV